MLVLLFFGVVKGGWGAAQNNNCSIGKSPAHRQTPAFSSPPHQAKSSQTVLDKVASTGLTFDQSDREENVRVLGGAEWAWAGRRACPWAGGRRLKGRAAQEHGVEGTLVFGVFASVFAWGQGKISAYRNHHDHLFSSPHTNPKENGVQLAKSHFKILTKIVKRERHY